MGRRDLLSAEERHQLFGVPVDRDALARLYTFELADLGLIEARREDRNRLGFAVQLALIRHPGLTLAQVTEQPGVDLEPLVSFIASQLQLPAAALADYAAREQTMTDHARELGAALGLCPPARTDLSLMIDAAASAAWSTDKGALIAGAVVAAPHRVFGHAGRARVSRFRQCGADRTRGRTRRHCRDARRHACRCRNSRGL